MFDIGFLEIMVVGILGLLILGPERLPKAARTVGLLIGKIRRTMGNIQDDLERQVRTEELKNKLQDPYATFMDDEERAAAEAKEEAQQQAEQKAAAREAAISTPAAEPSASSPEQQPQANNESKPS